MRFGFRRLAGSPYEIYQVAQDFRCAHGAGGLQNIALFKPAWSLSFHGESQQDAKLDRGPRRKLLYAGGRRLTASSCRKAAKIVV